MRISYRQPWESRAKRSFRPYSLGLEGLDLVIQISKYAWEGAADQMRSAPPETWEMEPGQKAPFILSDQSNQGWGFGIYPLPDRRNRPIDPNERYGSLHVKEWTDRDNVEGSTVTVKLETIPMPDREAWLRGILASLHTLLGALSATEAFKRSGLLPLVTVDQIGHTPATGCYLQTSLRPDVVWTLRGLAPADRDQLDVELSKRLDEVTSAVLDQLLCRGWATYAEMGFLPKPLGAFCFRLPRGSTLAHSIDWMENHPDDDWCETSPCPLIHRAAESPVDTLVGLYALGILEDAIRPLMGLPDRL